MRRSPIMTISFDRNSADLYYKLQNESEAEEIKASGLVRRILRKHFYEEQKSDAGTPASKT